MPTAVLVSFKCSKLKKIPNDGLSARTCCMFYTVSYGLYDILRIYKNNATWKNNKKLDLWGALIHSFNLFSGLAQIVRSAYLHSSCLSTCISVAPAGWIMKFDTETFMKIFQGTNNLVKLRKKYWALYMKKKVHF